MFLERLKTKFNINEPIFAEEILAAFPEYTRAYIFRIIDKAKKEGDIAQFSTGVYYIPKKTVLGLSTITAEDVVRKKYITNESDIYGVYGGVVLQNAFSSTTQRAVCPEIITNNEATRRREIILDGMRFVLRKSRCKIDKQNARAYTVLQLIDEEEELSDITKQRVVEFLKAGSVDVKQLTELSLAFPGRTLKKLIRSGILDEIA